MPPVWLYALTWNERPVLPFFFRHYDPWVDRYFLYDDGSTDGTLDLLRAHPRVTLRRFDRAVPRSFVESHRLWQNHAWKEARGQARWVVVTAIDEHLWHPDMPAYLASQSSRGVTAIPALGFNMFCDRFPPPDALLSATVRSGIPATDMNKLSLFDPTALTETQYGPGRHYALPEGMVRYPEADEMLLLHYKYLGLDYVTGRNATLDTGLGPHDREAGLGAQYTVGRAAWEQAWPDLRAHTMDYRDASVGFATHLERWWREPRRRG